MMSKNRPNGLLSRGTQVSGKQTDTQHIYPTKTQRFSSPCCRIR